MIYFSQITKGSVFGFEVAMSSPKRVSVAILNEATEANKTFLVAFADVHVITRGAHDPAYGAYLRTFDLICPDGMPLVWQLREKNNPAARHSHRIAGPDVMSEVWNFSQSTPEIRHFLLGGTQEMLDKLQQELSSLYPNATLAGSYSPPFGDWDDTTTDAIIKHIEDATPNIIWIGLGAPKQEIWLAEHAHLLPHGVYLAVGAAFAFHSGMVPRAPQWMQSIGLEWFYRILREPRRLFKRYLIWNTLFLLHLVPQAIQEKFRRNGN